MGGRSLVSWDIIPPPHLHWSFQESNRGTLTQFAGRKTGRDPKRGANPFVQSGVNQTQQRRDGGGSPDRGAKEISSSAASSQSKRKTSSRRIASFSGFGREGGSAEEGNSTGNDIRVGSTHSSRKRTGGEGQRLSRTIKPNLRALSPLS